MTAVGKFDDQIMTSHKHKLAIFSIATNRYLDLYSDLIDSYSKKCDRRLNVEFHLFTDQIEKAHAIFVNYPWMNVLIHKIDPHVWPEATLLRYQIYLEEFGRIEADYFMHLDADMLFLSDIGPHLEDFFINDSMLLVLHPGFYRPTGIKYLKFALARPQIVVKDLSRKIHYGGIGSWEKNKNSSSFVTRSSRKKYYCGGTWIGSSRAFKNFLEVNAKNVGLDRRQGVMAVWHDESHLNNWAANNTFIELGPAFCYEPTYPQLKSIQPIIMAVDKNYSRNTGK